MDANERPLTHHLDFSSIRHEVPKRRQNVGNTERIISAVGGGMLAAFGLYRRNALGYTLAALGGALLHRGASGYCALNQAIGRDTTEHGGTTGKRLRHGTHVEKSVIINRPVEDVYGFWRNFENLPRFMRHLQSVECIDERRSRWVAKAPAGTTVEWEAEITGDRPNEMITWRSVEGSTVENAGSVIFKHAPGDRGCELRVNLRYNPPAGKLGTVVAKLFHEEPGQQVAEDLRRLKQVLETGEVASVEGQPRGQGGS